MNCVSPFPCTVRFKARPSSRPPFPGSTIPLLAAGLTLTGWACTPQYYVSHHPALVQDLIQYKIGRIEERLSRRPADPDLLLQASRTLTEYGFGFILEEADRIMVVDYRQGVTLYRESQELFSRAVQYGTRSLGVQYPAFAAWLETPATQEIHFGIEDIPRLYWTAAAYAGAIKASRGAPQWLVHLPKVGLLLETALGLDPDWDQGALYTAMIAYSMQRPDAGAERQERAKFYLEKAVIASRGYACAPYVTYAENVSLKNQDREEFQQMLLTALGVDLKGDSRLGLANTIARQRAAWLLNRMEELFY